MVNPILLVAVPLGVAFLMPLLRGLDRAWTRGLHLLTLLFVALVSGLWLRTFLGGAEAVLITTGGWPPPLGISLRLGTSESGLILLGSLTAFAAALHLFRSESKEALRGSILQILILMGSIGLVMTRDLFNVFVFLEIASIASYAYFTFGAEKKGLESGFKYIMMGALASSFLLLAIGFLYKTTGTLNLDDMAARLPQHLAPGMGAVLVFLLVAMMAELKLFPLNGPAIDTYEGVEPGVMALLVGTSVNALFFVFLKMQVLFILPGFDTALMTIGMTTFLLANFMATRQENVRRMLGYSSSAQLGLLVFFLPFFTQGLLPGRVLALLLVNHSLAKAGLLLLAGNQGRERIERWRNTLRSGVAMRLTLVILVLAITGLPPFPGFWGKWMGLVALARNGASPWIIPLLIGSFFEMVYYFGWLRRVWNRGEAEDAPVSLGEGAPEAGLALLLLAGGIALMRPVLGAVEPSFTILLGSGLALLFLLALPASLRAGLSLVALAAAAWPLYRTGGFDLSSLSGFFMALTILGSFLTLLASAVGKGLKRSFQGVFLILASSLVLLLEAGGLLAFFAAWEMMTWASYLLVSQGRRGERPGFIYMLFAAAAGFLILGGMMLAESAGIDTIAGLSHLSGGLAWSVWTLLAAGFAVKVAAWGAHIWAPDAYSEAPDIFSAFLSGVLSKIPLFALMLVSATLGTQFLAGRWGWIEPAHLLAWIGGLSAFGMTLLAVFQEDAKRLLAYSSLGQVGYILLALAILTPLGWTAALFHVVLHMLFKALLFLAVAGVILRTGTRKMHEMGGLIRNMPVSFISVLIGIIAVSGVPPLAGFASKWLLYQALMAKGWLFLLALSMFSSMIAFLYLFRLIHTIFLGQRKTRHRDLREAPWPLWLGQAVLMGLIMLLSVWPQTILEPIQRMLTPIFGNDALEFASKGLINLPAGYFNAAGVMILVIGIFVTVFLFLLSGPRPRRVGQMDIVYAGEVPPPAEELHYAFDFFRPYERAFAPVLRRAVSRFWVWAAESTGAVADAGRRIYTGNPQTYLLYFVILAAALALWGLDL